MRKICSCMRVPLTPAVYAAIAFSIIHVLLSLGTSAFFHVFPCTKIQYGMNALLPAWLGSRHHAAILALSAMQAYSLAQRGVRSMLSLLPGSTFVFSPCLPLQ